MNQTQLPHIDVRERGATVHGEEQVMDQRVFMQLLVVSSPVGADPQRYVDAFDSAFGEKLGVQAVVYADINHPRRLGLLSWSTSPGYFVEVLRPLFRREDLRDLKVHDEMTMFGRSYGSGYEQNLEFWVLDRPVQTVVNPQWPWAVWYPLRRNGAFEKLEPKEKRNILMEHAHIGRAYGSQDLAHDVRLACHGIDANDNEFLIGLVGAKLHPLSHVVQSMRKTKQTSEYIQQMGPFFVGRRLLICTG